MWNNLYRQNINSYQLRYGERVSVSCSLWQSSRAVQVQERWHLKQGRICMSLLGLETTCLFVSKQVEQKKENYRVRSRNIVNTCRQMSERRSHIGNMKGTWVIYLGQSTNDQLVLSWKPRKLIMVSERAQYTDPLIRPGQWSDHPISWWPIEGSVPPKSLENKSMISEGVRWILRD